MRTVTLKSVIDGVAQLMGIPPATLPDEDRGMFCEFITQRVDTAWKYDWFPEWLLTEQRAYRDDWSASLTYAANAEVYFPTDGKYYAANSAPNNPVAGDSPASAPAKWTELTGYAKYIARDQTGKTVIDGVKRLCLRDPRLNITNPGEIEHGEDDRGIIPSRRAGATVWVQFQTLPPVYSVTPWAIAENNLAGDVRYRANTGDCYIALAANVGQVPEQTAAYWRKQPVPALLASYLKQGAYANALRGDGQTDKALAEDKVTTLLLIQADDAAFAGQGN